MKNSVRVLWGFIFGLFVQTAMIYVAERMNCSKPILWACGASFLITMAVVAGMFILGTEVKEERDRVRKQNQQRGGYLGNN